MSSPPVINAPCGPVKGFIERNVTRYTGIPYAQAARFKLPKPVKPWTEPFEASSPCPACPQLYSPGDSLIIPPGRSMLEGLPVDEHCQCLSITAPENVRPDEKLSVMVWVHGGSFTTGAGDSAGYHPSKLVTEHRVIVVNINYRLNLFGFLGDGKRLANLGLLDQLEALRWVKRNISAFGGNDDPKSITFFGQSAGASSVADIMSVGEAPTLFGRAILQSSPFGITRGRDEMNGFLFGVVNKVSPASTIEEMLSLTEAVQKAGAPYFLIGGMPFAPQYGHAPLPAEAKVDETLNASASQIDVLVGSTENEASLFMPFIPWIKTAINIPIIGSFIHNYAVSSISDKLYHQGDKAFVKRHIEAGGKASLYRIVWSAKGNRLGATHTIELPLLFGREEDWKGGKMLEGSEWNEVEEAGRKLRALWADFAKGKQLGKADGVDGLIHIV